MTQKFSEEKSIPSDVKNIKPISMEIVQRLESLKADPSDIFDIKLCVEEALRNAIEHGNKHNQKKLVKLTYSIDRDNFLMTVIDQGEGFDVNDIPNPVKTENLWQTGGRGVYLIARLMDKAVYNEKGNELKIAKRFQCTQNNGDGHGNTHR